MDVGTILRKLRGDRTVDEVANAVGVTKQAISNYENNIRVPRDEIKVKLAEYFETTVGEIFFVEKSNR